MKRLVLFAFAAIALLATGCKKDKNDPVATWDAKEITSSSAVLYGHVNSKSLKDSKEMGIMISKSYNPEDAGKKYPATIIDKKNVFNIKVDNLAPATKYYYVAYVTIGAASYVGKTKSFTTKEFEGGGGGQVDVDKSPIKLGRWDAYHQGDDTHIDYCLIFSENSIVDQYDFLGGFRLQGTYTFENDRLVINAQKWWGGAYTEFPDIYEYLDPETLQPYNGKGWHETNNSSDIQYFYDYFRWWFDREFILDSPTTAHGEGEFDDSPTQYTYKFRE